MTFRSTAPPLPPGSTPPSSALAGSCKLGGGPSPVMLDRAALAGDAAATPRDCRSPASRAGRPRRPGVGCGWPTWPGSLGSRQPRAAMVMFTAARRRLRPGTACKKIRSRHPDALLALQRQRRRPVTGPRLSGADHRAGAARRAQHQMGGRHRLRGALMRARWQKRFPHRLRVLPVASVDHGSRVRATRLCAGHLQTDDPVESAQLVAVDRGVVRRSRDRPRSAVVSAVCARRPDPVGWTTAGSAGRRCRCATTFGYRPSGRG